MLDHEVSVLDQLQNDDQGAAEKSIDKNYLPHHFILSRMKREREGLPDNESEVSEK